MKTQYGKYVKRALNAPVHRIIQIKPALGDSAEDVRNNIAVQANVKHGPGFISTKVLHTTMSGRVVLTCRLR